MRLSNLVNIGPKMESLLVSVGIEDVETLRNLGAAEAAFRIVQQHPDCEIRITALEGALRGTRWNNISESERDELEVAYKELCTSSK